MNFDNLLSLTVQYRLERIGKSTQQFHPGTLEIYFSEERVPAFRITDQKSQKVDVNVKVQDIKSLPPVLPVGESTLFTVPEGNLHLKFASNDDLKKFYAKINSSLKPGTPLNSSRSQMMVHRDSPRSMTDDHGESSNNLSRQIQSMAQLTPIGGGPVIRAQDISALANDYGTPPTTSGSFMTPVSRFLASQMGDISMASSNASASLLLGLSQTVDHALRSATQSQESLLQGILEQNRALMEHQRAMMENSRMLMEHNRALANTCDGLASQMKELTMVNKSLVEETKRIREIHDQRATQPAVAIVPETGGGYPVPKPTTAAIINQPSSTTTTASISTGPPAAKPTPSIGIGQQLPKAPDAIPKVQGELPSLSEMFKPKPGSWPCKDCYTRNDAAAIKCVCCGASSPAAAATATTTTTIAVTPAIAAPSIFTAPANSSGGFRFPTPSVPAASIFPLPPATLANAFPTPALNSSTAFPTPIGPTTKLPFTGQPTTAPFGTTPTFPVAATTTTTAPPATTTSTSIFTANIFGGPAASTMPSFASVAAAQSAFQNTAGQSQQQGFNKAFGNTSNQIFGSFSTSTPQRARQESENEDTGAEVPFEPNVDFKPIIPLPDLIEAKTGEEEEEVLFKERAKLYRFDQDTAEMKERGVGDIKLLKHRQTGKCRLLMRREQVLKICANHSIHGDLKLVAYKKSDRCYIWHCQDYSDGELKDETFAIRFKDVDLAKRFKEVFDQCVAEAGGNSPSIKSNATVKAPIATSTNQQQQPLFGPTAQSSQQQQPKFGQKSPWSQQQQPALASLGKIKEEKPPIWGMFKPPPGSWGCNDCYTTNEANATKCIACEAPAPTAVGGGDDITIVHEVKPNEEQKAMASKFNLPDAFYVDRDPCEGCIGCADEEVQDRIFRELERLSQP